MCENVKPLQERKGEGLPTKKDEILLEKENEGLPRQKDGDLQKEEDGALLGQKDEETKENVDDRLKEVADEGQTTVPMLPLPSADPVHATAGYAMERKSVPVVIKEGALSQDTEMTSVASDPNANVQAASGSETHDGSYQEEDGEVLSSDENVKLLQVAKGEGAT